MDKTAARVRFHEKGLNGSEIADLRVAERQVSGFYLAEAIYPPGFRIPRHSHVNASLYLVLQGTSSEISGGKICECKPLSVVLTPPGEAHSERYHGAGGRCFIIEMTPGWVERLRECSIRLSLKGDFQGGPLAWLALRLRDEFRRTDDVSPLAIEGLALEIMAAASRQRAGSTQREAPRWLLRAREILHARFRERVELGDLAEAVGVHPVHLATAFRRHHRRTVGEYIRKLRIEFACQKMTASDAPLAEIALAAGFADQSHFSKTFKQATGLSPARFRAHFRPS